MMTLRAVKFAAAIVLALEAPEAIRYLEEGHARGKVVITV